MNQLQQPKFVIQGVSFPAPRLAAGLYLVATPIGNLGDITLRALQTLAGATVIACEDTRTSGTLLQRYGIDRPKVSYNEHNADRRGADLIRQIGEGAAVALISDAGTPLVSDPGYRLVKQAAQQSLPVIPLPGASAPLAALVGSGLGTGNFTFCGFLPNKTRARQSRIAELADEAATLMFFESPNRLKAALQDLSEGLGPQRPATVCRELTKMYETFHRGTLEHLLTEFEALERIRGEIVIVVEGAPQNVADQPEEVRQQLLDALKTMKTKQAAKHVAQATGLSKQDLYKRTLELQKEP